MNLSDYKQKISLYDKLSCTVRDILIAAISASTYQYHLQQIQCRAKTYDSLAKRLEDMNATNSDNIEELRHDLAGCRTIFYYNDDVNIFLESGIIRDNFKVHWDKSKIHGPGTSAKTANDYYTANHYIVELNEERLKLAEYSDFKGIKCEIQIHTVLNHAWSETAHDITYKRHDISDFGKNIIDSIDNRLTKIMEDHLKPAGYEFQKIQRDHCRLLEGKKLLGRNLSEELVNCRDNNERYEILERYREYTLPLFSDYQDELSAIIDFVNTAIAESNKIGPIEIETPLGTITGKTAEDILKICLSITDYVRYVDVTRIFPFLVKLYETLTEDYSKNCIKKAISNLIKYNMDVLKREGFSAQNTVISILKNFDDNRLQAIKPLIVDIGSCVLDSTVEGYSNTYNSTTIRVGSIAASEQVFELRKQMLNLLFNNYNFNDHESIKRRFIYVFNTATKTPRGVNYSEEMFEMILENCKEIIEFYITLISEEQYEILVSIESDICFIYHRSLEALNRGTLLSEASKTLCHSIMEKSIKFRDVLNENREYLIYKTLVGTQSVFAPHWTKYDWDLTARNEYREAQIISYVKKITKDNQDYWKEIIIRCTQTKSHDMAALQIFCRFLNFLSAEHPIFSFDLIKKHQQELIRFSTCIFPGLLKSNLHDDVLKQIKQWVNDGRYLGECARVFEYIEPLDLELLKLILNKASHSGDSYALSILIATTTQIYDGENDSLIKLIFIPAIKALTKLKNTNWINDFWYREKGKELLSKLKLNEVKVVLSNLLLLTQIDFNAEEVIFNISKEHPIKIIQFFRKRIDIEFNSENRASYFEAVPFNFHRISPVMIEHLDKILTEITSWHDDNDCKFQFGGAKLISIIFPKYTSELDKKLFKMVTIGNEKKYRTVIAILSNYNEGQEINNICKKIISSIPEGSDLIKKISNIMKSTEVVKGEFALASVLQKKVDSVSSWREDSNPNVRAFAENYINELKKQIVLEQRRVEEYIELRKHQFVDDKT